MPVETLTFTVGRDGGPVDAGADLHPVTLAHTRTGSGEPLLLVHGIGHHGAAWDPVLPALRARHEVIAVDLPGFGDSPSLPGALRYDIPTVARVLGAFAEELGLERPHVAGNSLGGLLALRLGHENAVRSVTALSPAGFSPGWEQTYLFAVLGALHATSRLLPERAIRSLARSAAGRWALTSTIYARPGRRDPAATVAEVLSLRGCTDFARARTGCLTTRFADPVTGPPVTIAWGDRDRLLLPRQGTRAQLAVPGAEFIRLGGCGHVPMNDDPELVARVLLEGAGRGR
ncbi:alpha/beta fold hydrolase [Streptomyces sp. NA04227]|uniref:alpha/beta fold hydrolase n=1 Tax=Streptomyces sp. NA04227 TaxID=2742136 RepID=UPI00159272C5|nr:alpha/beta fold hydrolase [Streptomyces sp. NA04227]QKW07537.1 alpha/beta fold hydrolase [Streptomyces sp. NA04227]